VGMEIENFEAIQKTKSYSNDSICKLRGDLTSVLSTPDILVVTVGSFARREASTQSDIDYFVIYKGNKAEAKKDYKVIEGIFKESKLRMPSNDGAFSNLHCSDDMLTNVGGNIDTTETLTRRMLFLLECEWLFNENYYHFLFDGIIKKYVKSKITQHQLCRFLLNDLIRYYRTICVDFEYKTDERGKSWGDRNIKLMFSRKLLYFSGILTIAETVQHTCDTKREVLKEKFSMTPTERIIDICGEKAKGALTIYDEFIKELSTSSVRKMLNNTAKADDSQTEEFRRLKNKGHHFSWELSRLLSETYDVSHPIHHAIKF